VRTRTLVLVVGLAVLLAGCGRQDGGRDAGTADVASLASATAVAASPSGAAERPLVRTDMSPEEEERLWDEWQRCLEQHGHPGKRAADAQDPKAAAAEQACQGKRPEQVWERAKRTDPQYGDRLREWVTCIRSHGIDAWEENGFLAFKSLPPDDQMKKVDECQDKAFGKG
jgi:hypothetical protein